MPTGTFTTYEASFAAKLASIYKRADEEPDRGGPELIVVDYDDESEYRGEVHSSFIDDDPQITPAPPSPLPDCPTPEQPSPFAPPPTTEGSVPFASADFTPPRTPDELSAEQKTVLFGHLARNLDSCKRAAAIMSVDDFDPFAERPEKLFWAALAGYVGQNAQLPPESLLHIDCASRMKGSLEFEGNGAAEVHHFIAAAYAAPAAAWNYCREHLARWLKVRRVKPLMEQYAALATTKALTSLMDALEEIKAFVEDDAPLATIRSLKSMMAEYKQLRPPVIEGLVRVGENMNVIAPPKFGKSWLTIDMGLSVAVGLPWLGFVTVAGRVLIVDNELHPETIADRVPRVAKAKGIAVEDYQERIEYLPLRGKLKDINGLKALLQGIPPGTYKLIILDAFYRLLPEGTDENDNGAMTAIYNKVDALADRLQAAFVLVHHTSKGPQGGRAATDVGSGAGAISRATDDHLVMRAHAEVGAVVLEAAPRSFTKVNPIGLRFEFPLWTLAPDLDVNDLKKPGTKPKQACAAAAVAPVGRVKSNQMTKETFLASFISDEPRSNTAIIEKAGEAGVSNRRAKDLLKLLEDENQIVRVTRAGGRAPTFVRAPVKSNSSAVIDPSTTPDTPCTHTLHTDATP